MRGTVITGGGPLSSVELERIIRELLFTEHRELTRYRVRDVQHGPALPGVNEPSVSLLVETHSRLLQTHHTGLNSGVNPWSAEDQELYVGLSTELVDPALVPWQQEAQDRLWSAWIHPYDPLLPDLAWTATPSSVARTWAGEGSMIALRTLSYRPLRRAVLRADIGGTGPENPSRSVYIKVLRDGRAVSVYERHQMLRAAGIPAAEPVGEPYGDALAFHSGTGTGLARLVMQDGAAAVHPEAISSLLDQLPDQILDFPGRPAWTDRWTYFLGLATQTFPDQQGRLRRLASRIEHALDRAERGPVVPSHGDLYEAHLMFNQGTVSTLLDVDTLGPGHRVDDLACLLGHLSVLPTADARHRHSWATTMRFFRHLEPSVPGAGLAARAAAVVISLIPTSAHTVRLRRAGEARLRIAEQWMSLSN